MLVTAGLHDCPDRAGTSEQSEQSTSDSRKFSCAFSRAASRRGLARVLGRNSARDLTRGLTRDLAHILALVLARGPPREPRCPCPRCLLHLWPALVEVGSVKTSVNMPFRLTMRAESARARSYTRTLTISCLYLRAHTPTPVWELKQCDPLSSLCAMADPLAEAECAEAP